MQKIFLALTLREMFLFRIFRVPTIWGSGFVYAAENFRSLSGNEGTIPLGVWLSRQKIIYRNTIPIAN